MSDPRRRQFRVDYLPVRM